MNKDATVCQNNMLKRGITILILSVCFLLSSYIWVHNCVPTIVADGQYYYCDQTIFEVIGKAWSQGIPAYTKYFDHKGPFVFLFFCLGYLVDGTRHGLGLFYTVWLAISMGLCYCLWRKSYFRETTVICKLAATIFSIFSALMVCSLTIVQGITVGHIMMPMLLGCCLIYQHWIQNGDFLSTRLLHIIYGVLCAVIVLSRASDAVMLFMLYVVYWCYHLIKRNHIIIVVSRAGLTIVGGLIPFIACLIYFGHYGVIDEFMDCTFWINLRYSPADSTSQEMIPYFLLLGFVIMSITMMLTCIQHKKDNVHLLVCVVIAMGIHFVFLFVTSMYTQYLSSHMVGFLLLFMTYFWLDEYFYTSKRKLQACGWIVMPVVVVCFCGLLAAEHTAVYIQLRQAFDSYTESYLDEAIDYDGTVLVFDNEYFTGRLLDSGKMPPNKYCMFHTWHIKSNVNTMENLIADIHSSNPDRIYAFFTTDNLDSMYGFSCEDIFKGYHYDLEYDWLVDMENIDTDIGQLSYEFFKVAEYDVAHIMRVYDKD